MTEEQQRNAIADECRWENISSDLGIEFVEYTRGGTVYHGDPLINLDAIHAAEKTLIVKGKTAEFYLELVAVTTVDRFFLVHATAAQRSEAFLRTLGRWTP